MELFNKKIVGRCTLKMDFIASKFILYRYAINRMRSHCETALRSGRSSSGLDAASSQPPGMFRAEQSNPGAGRPRHLSTATAPKGSRSSACHPRTRLGWSIANLIPHAISQQGDPADRHSKTAAVGAVQARFARDRATRAQVNLPDTGRQGKRKPPRCDVERCNLAARADQPQARFVGHHAALRLCTPQKSLACRMQPRPFGDQRGAGVCLPASVRRSGRCNQDAESVPCRHWRTSPGCRCPGRSRRSGPRPARCRGCRVRRAGRSPSASMFRGRRCSR